LGLVVVGLVLLGVSAEALLRGASDLARRFGVSELFIGLTVVSLGTSAPEMVVCVQSALAGHPDIALGNVVGSNLFNLLAILGLAALITPIPVQSELLQRDTYVKVGAALLMFGMASDGVIGRMEGFILLTLLVAFITWAYFEAVRAPQDAADAIPKPFDELAGVKAGSGSLPVALAATVAGLVGLAVGADWFLKGSVGVARALGVSELIIGLTLVAAGTSLPEMFATLLAAIRGKADIAVGNIIGSNICNILAILGATAAIAPVQVAPQLLRFDIPYLLAVSIISLPIFLRGNVISRGEGALLFSAYVLYSLLLLQGAQTP